MDGEHKKDSYLLDIAIFYRLKERRREADYDGTKFTSNKAEFEKFALDFNIMNSLLSRFGLSSLQRIPI